MKLSGGPFNGVEPRTLDGGVIEYFAPKWVLPIDILDKALTIESNTLI